jgi:hypothetical protein
MNSNDIENHYKQYGNTNLITNSGLKNNSQIYAIGDSHTIFFHNSMKIYEHWGWESRIPLTMYTFVNKDFSIYNVGNLLGNGHEKYNIKSNDYVIFYYGYNDVQRRFYSNFNNNTENNINSLLDKYINKIIFLKNAYKIIPIVPCIYPLPIKLTGMNILGSEEERTNYTLITNRLLKDKCKENNILYLDIYDDISKNNKINEKYTVDGIHLDYNNNEIRELVERKIYELIL